MTPRTDNGLVYNHVGSNTWPASTAAPSASQTRALQDNKNQIITERFYTKPTPQGRPHSPFERMFPIQDNTKNDSKDGYNDQRVPIVTDTTLADKTKRMATEDIPRETSHRFDISLTFGEAPSIPKTTMDGISSTIPLKQEPPLMSPLLIIRQQRPVCIRTKRKARDADAALDSGSEKRLEKFKWKSFARIRSGHIN
eukprot:jgi/Psemu1/8994/gm1.8994_g